MAGSGAKPVYGIGAVARMLGITSATLRAWEERYGVIVPARSGADHRLYSSDEVDQLRYVQNLIGSGLHAAEAHRLLAIRRAEGNTLIPSWEPDTSAVASILLAERDVYAADVVEYLLRTEGYEVAIGLDAADARRLFDERHPNLVVVELVISGGSGLELCRQLCTAGAVVMAVSALALGDAALEAGAEAFLGKPLEPLQVLSTVKDLLGTSRRQSGPVHRR
jgi:DNA-binding transcriptional MerR regulator